MELVIGPTSLLHHCFLTDLEGPTARMHQAWVAEGDGWSWNGKFCTELIQIVSSAFPL